MSTSLVTRSSLQTPQVISSAKASPIVLYFLLAYLGTWILFLPLMLDPTLSSDLFGLLFVLSAYTGPTLAAMVVTQRTTGWQGVRQLFGRLLRWRVGFRWYLAALFSFMVVWFGGYSIAYNGAPIQALVTQPQVFVTVFLPFVLTIALIPALGEEIGWRGFALPHLQQRYGPVKGTLILGFMHSLWHLPAFFTPVLGPFVPMTFLTFLITGTAGSFIYTWVFNNTRQSILIAVLLHAAANGASVVLGFLLAEHVPSSEFFLDLVVTGWFNALLFVVAAVVLVVATRAKLGYETSR